MTAGWMLYSLAVGALACLAALAAERIVGIWSGPRRLVWAAAMAGTVLVPTLLVSSLPTRARRKADIAKVEVAVVRARGRPVAVARPGALIRVRSYVYRIARQFDRPARIVWWYSSALLALAYLIAVARIRLERRGWTEARLGGHAVLVTSDVGPALVGFLDPRIVVPRWALDLAPLERRFMLHHELEHLGADDPRLLMIAGLVLVVFPWNAALWWMMQRLRLAIEIDCDTRVVQTCGAPREYGLFLLAVGERRTRSLPLAASLAERRSLLERRIRAMTMQRPRYPLLASLPLAAICTGAMTLAAQTPQPVAGTVARAVAIAPPADRIQVSPDQVRSIVASRYPELAAGTADENLLTVVISSAGQLVATGVSQSATVTFIKPKVVTDANVDSASRALVERRLVAVARAASAGTIAPSVPSDSAVLADREKVLMAKALVEARGQTEGGTGMMNLAGVGQVDPSLVHDMYTLTFNAGEVSARPLRVRVVTLSGNSTK